MERIGDRIKYWHENGITRIVISGHTEKWKEMVLATWLAVWAVCIIIFASQLGGDYSQGEKLFFGVLVGAMIYFFVRLGKVWLWRKYGKELISITNDQITVKRDRNGYGKAYSYFLENVKKLGLVVAKETSFKAQLENSPWVLGGERVGFEAMGAKVKFGMQLNEEDAKQLVGLIKHEIKTRKAIKEN